MMDVIYVPEGETSTGIVLNDWNTMFIDSGGTAYNTTVAIGCDLNVDGTAYNTTVNADGSMTVSDDGTAITTKVNAGGIMTVSTGAKATGITADAGALLSFAVAPGTEVQGTYDGSAFEIKDSVADGFTIYDYCELTVSSGGTAKVTTVKENGRLYVANDGKATEATVKGNGRLFVSAGAKATGITADAGAQLFFDVAPGTEVQGTYDGSAFEIKDGIFDGCTVYDSCTFTVRYGGKVTNAEVQNKGMLYVMDNGLADKTTVNYDADLVIHSGGTAKETTVKTGGRLFVFSGGLMDNATVNEGGQLTVSYGGIASNVTVKNNGVLNLYGKVTGRMDFDDDAAVSAIELNGNVPVLDFDLTQTTAGADPLVNTLAVIVGTPKYTLTVDGTQENGTYKLAGNAAGFGDRTITVVNDSGKEYGRFSLGKTLYKYGKSYTLALDGSTLAVTVDNAPSNIFCDDLENETKDINAGSSAVNVNVNDKGWLHINNGGVAIDTTLLNEGMPHLEVYAGGVASHTTVKSYYMTVYEGGKAIDTVVSGCTTTEAYLVLSSTGVASNTTVYENGALAFRNGGIASKTTVNSGGSIYFTHECSGGVLYDTTINASGLLRFYINYVDGVVYNTIINAGTVVIVGANVASNTTVHSGGRLFVGEGGTANGVTVKSGGMFEFSTEFEEYDGGKLTGKMTFEQGASINVTNDGGTIDFDLRQTTAGADPLLNDFSFVTNDKLSFTLTVDGTQENVIYKLAGNAADFGDRTITVVNASDETLGTLTLDGGTQTFGGLEYRLTMDSTTLAVLVGSLVFSGVVESGTKNIANPFSAVDVKVNDKGILNVFNGGTASNTEVNAGGSMTVANGGSANDTTVNAGGEMHVSDFGIAKNTAVDQGGRMIVSNGGSANDTTVNAGGSMAVTLDGKAHEISENGGWVELEDGADVTFVSNTFSGTVLQDKQSATVHSGTTATDVTIDDGLLLVCGGAASKTTVNENGEITLRSGSAVDATINAGGRMIVSNGCTADNTTVNAGGEMHVSDFGIAKNTAVDQGGRMIVSNGGSANDTTVNAGGSMAVTRDGKVSGATVNQGGTLYVSNGGSALEVMENGGYVVFSYISATVTIVPNMLTGLDLQDKQSALIHSGTTANDVTVGEGCLFGVLGGIASKASVNAGGMMNINFGGTVTGATVNEGGKIGITSAAAKNTVVSGGSVTIYSSGSAIDTTVGAGGTVVLSSGGKFTGKMMFETGAKLLVVEAGAILDFDLTQTAPGADALVNDLSIPMNATDWFKNPMDFVYTLTVDGTQDSGIYKLAGNAAGFDRDIAVKNTLGEELVTLTVNGETKEIDGVKYTLTLAGSDLAVQIAAPVFTGVVENATKDITKPWTAVNVKVNENGILNVFDGGRASNTQVNAGGSMTVSDGGRASNTQVNTGGSMTVFDGGNASNTTVNAGGEMYVSAGCEATGVTVNYDGYLEILSDGSVTDVVENGGYVYIEDEDEGKPAKVTFKANVFSGLALNGTWASIHSGTTATDIEVNADGYLQITSGGSLANITVNDSGNLAVFGGTTGKTTVTSGGTIDVYGGGTAGNVTVTEGGELHVSRGGTATGAMVSGTDAEILVSSGGTANDTTIDAEGYMEIFSDGIANNTKIASTGDTGGMFINSGGTANGVTVDTAGYLCVSEGASAADVVENGGYVFIEGDDEGKPAATVTFVSNTISGLALDGAGPGATVHSGTTATDIDINSAGRMDVYSGGSLTGATVNAGGEMYVFSGAIVRQITENGGYVGIDEGVTVTFVSNTFSGLVLQKEQQSASLNSGTTATDVTIESGGWLLVSGGLASKTNVNADGVITLLGGSAVDAKINAGGEIHVYEGTADNATVTAGGKMLVSANGTATDATVNANGQIHVSNGGKATGAKVSGADAEIHVSEGGIATGATLTASGGMAVSAGGTATDTTVSSGGILHVSAGGTANNIQLDPAGYLEIFSDGIANDIDTTAATNGITGGVYIKAGGKANGVTLNSGGYLAIFDGGAATGIVENGGYVYIEGEPEKEHPNVTFLPNSFSGLALDGTWATVHSGTTATDIAVSGKGGRLQVYSGGTANDVTVGPEGELWIYGGGLTNGLTVKSGGEVEIGPGGWLTGRMTFEHGATVVDAIDAILDFDLTQTAPGETALVNDLSFIPNTFLFSLTVDGTPENGLYSLAGGAAGFDQTLHVITPSGTELGTLTVGGGTKTIEGGKYTLIRDEDELSLLVGDPLPSEPDNNTLYLDKKTVNTAVTGSYGNRLKAAGQEIRLDQIDSIEGDYHNRVEKEGDTIDYAKIVLAHGAKLSFHAVATTAATFTVYSLSYNEKKDKYSLKKLQTLKLKYDETEKAFVADSKKALSLQVSGAYYVSMQFTDKKEEKAYYNVSLNGEDAGTVFYNLGYNGDDWNGKKTKELTGLFADLGTVDAARLATNNTVIRDEWIGFGDNVDCKKFTLASAAELSLTVRAPDGPLKFSICKLKTSGTGDKTTYSLVKVKTVTVKAGKGTASLDNLRLEAGDYYFKAQSSDIKKSTGYEAKVTQSDFYTDGDDGWNNVLLNGKKLSADDAFFCKNDLGTGKIYFDKAGNDKTSDDHAAFVCEANKKTYENFVGFGDEIDFAKITMSEGTSADVKFSLTATGDATLEVFKVTKKGEEKYTKKSLQTLKLKVGEEAESTATATKSVTLKYEADVSYYVSVKATNIKKAADPRAYYNVTYAVVSEEVPAPTPAMPETDSVASALAMPETDSLGMTDSLSFGQYGVDILADASASALAEFDDKSAWQNISMLA